jgi:hypothetical protein
MEFQLIKQNPRRPSPQGKVLFFKDLTEIIAGVFL